MYANLHKTQSIQKAEKHLLNLSDTHDDMLARQEFYYENSHLWEIPQYFGVKEFVLVESGTPSKGISMDREVLSAVQIACQNRFKFSVPTFLRDENQKIQAPIYEGYLSHDIVNFHFTTTFYPLTTTSLSLRALLENGSEDFAKKTINYAMARMYHYISNDMPSYGDIFSPYDIIDRIEFYSIDKKYNDHGIVILP